MLANTSGSFPWHLTVLAAVLSRGVGCGGSSRFRAKHAVSIIGEPCDPGAPSRSPRFGGSYPKLGG